MPDKREAEFAIIGGGPAGYTAAFRAADLGLSVTLIERRDTLGGVCLNVGCIPSKTLLHGASVIEEAAKMADKGIVFGKPVIDLDAVRKNRDSVTGKLTSGLEKLCEARKISVIKGNALFTGSRTLSVESGGDVFEVSFKKALIAAGSRPVKPAVFPEGEPGIWTSTDALSLKEIPEKLLIVGAGIIGLEMAAVYSAFGCSVTVVELLDQIIPQADADLVRPLYRKLKKELSSLLLGTAVTAVAPSPGGTFNVTLRDKGGKESVIVADRILVATGRRPNGDLVDAAKAGVTVDGKGFIPVNSRMQTGADGIYAAGDITGNPMLAHRASHQGKVAAEVAAGLKSEFTAMTIPSVAYTSPEIAWTGITEREAAEKGVELKKGVFPWAACGRALSADNASGFTKLLFDSGTGRLAGAGITGNNAGELISEAVLALEMGCDAGDIGDSVHPHPTLSETIAFAAEAAAGTVTDILPQKNS